MHIDSLRYNWFASGVLWGVGVGKTVCIGRLTVPLDLTLAPAISEEGLNEYG